MKFGILTGKVALRALMLGTASMPTVCVAAGDGEKAALSLAKFGVSIYSSAAAQLDPNLTNQPSFQAADPAAVQVQVKQLADGYRARLRESNATADMTHAF